MLLLYGLHGVSAALAYISTSCYWFTIVVWMWDEPHPDTLA
jgi:hypothetical protein